MKPYTFKLLFLTVALAACLISCKKPAPNEWLKDNTTIVGVYPVIASFTLPTSQSATVAAGSTVRLDLRYWSDATINKINLNETIGTGSIQTVSSTPYQKAYSTISRTDSLILQYQVPAGVVSGTTIVMQADVINNNSLDATATVNLKIQ